jgi:hypothetical protein
MLIRGQRMCPEMASGLLQSTEAQGIVRASVPTPYPLLPHPPGHRQCLSGQGGPGGQCGVTEGGDHLPSVPLWAGNRIKKDRGSRVFLGRGLSWFLGSGKHLHSLLSFLLWPEEIFLMFRFSFKMEMGDVLSLKSRLSMTWSGEGQIMD